MRPATLAARIAAGCAPTIVDVRSRSEFVRGHIPGAIHIPFWQLPMRRAHMPCSHDERLVLYCGHGPRAWMAGAVLRIYGFRHVSYLDGHMSRWSRAGLPQEKVASRK
jgi:rhodanese-related sulfurtransferase